MFMTRSTFIIIKYFNLLSIVEYDILFHNEKSLPPKLDEVETQL